MRYKITLSYDGAAFHGWQIQQNATSIQDCLQKSLSTLLNEEITITGAGRTDTGVNAVNYVAHFDSERAVSRDTGEICYKINAISPKEITVHSIVQVGDDFHARFSAKEREYKYFVHKKKDPFSTRFSWLCTFPLDVEKMNAAASEIIGTRDFSCFEKKGGCNKTSICTVSRAAWECYTPDHVRLLGYPCQEGDYLVFTIRADRFLRNMVRAVVGTLIEIGRGKKSCEWIRDVLESRDRSFAGESVPGYPLFLDGVEY